MATAQQLRGQLAGNWALRNGTGQIRLHPPRGYNAKFLARDTTSPYVDNRPMLVAGKPELREYKAVFVASDKEVSQFSDEITVNCAPMV